MSAINDLIHFCCKSAELKLWKSKRISYRKPLLARNRPLCDVSEMQAEITYPSVAVLLCSVLQIFESLSAPKSSVREKKNEKRKFYL